MKYLKLYSNKLTASGATTATTASKLVDSGASFTTTVAVGDVIYNSTDDTTATVTAVDSDTTLSIDLSLMASGEDYEIYKVNEYENPRIIPVDKVIGLKVTGSDPFIDFVISPEAGGDNIRANVNIRYNNFESVKNNFIVELEKLLSSSNKPICMNDYYFPKIQLGTTALVVRSVVAQN